MIMLGIPTLNRYDLLAECIESAVSGTVKPDVIEIVDNGGKLAENFNDFKRISKTKLFMEYKGVPINVFVPGYNYGVGRSWNRILHLCEEFAVICNDDIRFEENTIELMTNAVKENPKEIFFSPEKSYWEHAWSCFAQTKDSLGIIGEYDSNIFCYFEDRSYKYRMKLKGYSPFLVKECNYSHYEGGSNTIKDVDKTKFQQIFNETREYYLKCWGGLPESEVYTKAFDTITLNPTFP